jgi:hypothetical protein
MDDVMTIMSNCIFVKDIDGFTRIIPTKNLFDPLSELRIFGMTTDVIVELREAYCKAGGRLPITVDSVNEVFSDKPNNPVKVIAKPRAF